MERLSSILARLHVPGPGPLQLQRIRSATAKIDAQEGTPDVRVASLREGRLTLEVPSAAQAFELQAFSRDALLQELHQIAGLEEVKDVRIRVGSWRSNDDQRRDH